MPVRWCPPILFVLVILGFTTALAQETLDTPATRTTEKKNEPQDPKEEELPEMVVKEKQPQTPLKVKASTATKTGIPISDIPQSVQVITREVMEEQGALSLQEVMELNVPGIGFDTSNNTKDNFKLRGLSSQIFRDGLREISPPRFNLSDVERVEILKGPASVLYGRSEAGAMVNVISKRPVWDPMYDFSIAGKIFSGGRDEGYSDLGGLFDDTAMAVDIGGPIVKDKLAYRLTGYLEDAKGWRDFAHEDTRDLSLALEGRAGDRLTYSLRMAFYNRDQVTDRGLIGMNGQYPADRSTFYGSSSNLSATEQFLFEPSFEYEINDQLRLRNTFRYTIHDKEEVSLRARRVEDNFIGAFGGTPGSDGVYETVEREQRQIDENYEWFTEQFEVLGSFSPGGIRNDYLIGAEVTILDGTRQDFRLRDSDNLGDPLFHTPWGAPWAEVGAIDATINHPLASGKKDVDFEDKYYALYLQDQITVTEQWKLMAGARVDRYDEKLKNPYKTANPQQDVTEDVFSWRTGAVYQPAEWTSFYALASHGFKPTGGVYSSNIERDDGMDFEPEKNILYEIGNKSSFLDDRLAMTLSFYEGTRENFTTTHPDTGETEQIGEQRTRGAEVIVDARVTDNWSLRPSYAYTDAEYITRYSSGQDLSGKTPAFIPKNTFGFWTAYDFQGHFAVPLKVGGGMRWVDKRWQEDTNINKFDNYTVGDLFAEYAFNQHATLRLNVKNIANEEYFVSGTGYGDYAMPGDPLSASLALKIRF